MNISSFAVQLGFGLCIMSGTDNFTLCFQIASVVGMEFKVFIGRNHVVCASTHEWKMVVSSSPKSQGGRGLNTKKTCIN